MSTLHASFNATTPKEALSRRAFLARTAMATGGVAVFGSALSAFADTSLSSCPVVVFSKVYQELHLNFEDAAALTAESQMNCPAAGRPIRRSAAAPTICRTSLRLMLKRNS